MQEKKIGEIIAEAREKANLSQRQLAKIANISNAQLSKIESGEIETPNPKMLRKISQHINVNYNEMMYKIGLGMEVSPLNPFIKDYYNKMSLDELNEAEINVLGSITNLKQLVKSCEENLSENNPKWKRIIATYNRRYQLSNNNFKWNCKFNSKFKSKGEK